MINKFNKLFLISVIWTLPILSEANALESSDFITTTHEADPPAGWIDFCKRHNEDCSKNPLSLQRFYLTPALAKKVQTLNRNINARVKPVSDLENTHSLDDWEYPFNHDNKGDCEDYALYKRKELMSMGIPADALALVIVDTGSERHTVLVLRTNTGDFLLDNLNDKIVKWNESGYDFIKIQSYLEPNNWLNVAPPLRSATNQNYGTSESEGIQ